MIVASGARTCCGRHLGRLATLALVLVMLGDGTRLLHNLSGATNIKLEPIRVIAAPGVTHLKYRVLT
jgi:hypothetical protein